jgi:hypothetical protein
VRLAFFSFHAISVHAGDLEGNCRRDLRTKGANLRKHAFCLPSHAHAHKHEHTHSHTHTHNTHTMNTRAQGTLVVAGRGRGIVVGTGSNTAIGKIRCVGGRIYMCL